MKKRSILGLLLVLSSYLSSVQAKGEYLKVTGEARIFAIPERMAVSIPFEVESISYSECSDLLIHRYNDMLKSLIGNGFDKDKIKSSGLSINEKYNWVKNERKKIGFQGRIQMEVEAEYNKESLNNLMSALKNDKYDYGYNLSFKLSEKQKEDLLKEAIEKAVDDATTKANILAKSLNVELSKIVDINFDATTPVAGPLLRESSRLLMADNNAGASPELSLEAKPQQITKKVLIRWKIKQ